VVPAVGMSDDDARLLLLEVMLAVILSAVVEMVMPHLDSGLLRQSSDEGAIRQFAYSI